MIKGLLVIVQLIIAGQTAFSQCIDHEQIQTGYPFSNYKHSRYIKKDTVTYTNVYYFDSNGKVYDDYSKGNYLINDAIDVKQAAANSPLAQLLS